MDRTMLPSRARHRRVKFFEWALAGVRPVSGPAVTALLGAKAERPEPIDQWTAVTVRELLWLEVVDWCDERGVDLPDRVAETAWALFDHLEASGGWADGSDPLARLRAPLVESGGLDRRGRRRHPSTRPAV